MAKPCQPSLFGDGPDGRCDQCDPSFLCFDGRAPCSKPDPDPEPEPLAHARGSDPETSHEAAASVKNLRLSQAAILDVFVGAGRPLYDEQLIELYHRSHVVPHQSVSGIRSRRAELVAAGKLVHVDFAQTQAGRRTRVWALTEVAGG